MGNDLFAPPTKEELATKPQSDLFAPPSQEEIGQKSGFPQQQNFFQRHSGAVQGALNTLPMAGMVTGAAVGTIGGTPGLGTIAGAGGGGYVGESLKNLGEQYLLGQDKTRKEIYGNPVKGLIGGVAAESGGMLAGKAGEGIVTSKPGQATMKWAGSKLAKVGETLSGLPQKVIETYAKRKDEILSMAKSNDDNVAKAADDMREGFMKNIKATTKKMSDQIGSSLKDNPSLVDGNEIIQAIEAQKAKINPKLYPEERQKIDQYVTGQVKRVMNEDGMIPVADAHDLKRNLQDIANSAYQNPGQIFQSTDAAANTAKAGAAVARQSIDKLVPEVAGANSKLAEIHSIEDEMNRNMIAPGKAEAGLIAAGTGGNERNIMNLEKMGEATGQDMKSQAENLAAMKYMKNAALNPLEMTGKAAARMGTGGLLGGMASSHEGHGFYPGAAAGALLANPATVKIAIDSGLLGRKAIEDLATTPQGQVLLGKALGVGGNALESYLQKNQQNQGK